MEKTELENLGWNEFFEASKKDLDSTEHSIARVTSEHKGAYTVKNSNGEFLAKITGKQMFDATKREDFPAVGDWVAITELDKEKAVIHKVLFRKTILRKKYTGKEEAQIIATNIDFAFVVESVDRDYNLNRLERYFVLANEGGVKPVVVLNKIDLISESELKMKVEKIKNRFNEVEVISTSAIAERGMDELVGRIKKGKTYCFLGSSGVGKSSLINKLIGESVIKTGEIGSHSGRGKHVTTTRSMYFLKNGGIVIDNPGTREVGMAEIGTSTEDVFEEISVLSRDCKYSDCTHVQEPDCAVLKAVEDKELSEEKYQNYIRLKKESDHYEMTKFEKRRKDRKFGKFLKRSLKQLDKYDN